MKIIIIGCPASGKTTLANIISDKFGVPVLHLDKIFWVKPGGIKQEDFLDLQKEFMLANNSWIMDGGFTKSPSFNFRIENADTIIFFDFPKSIIVWRIIKRLLRDYGKTRKDMPEGRKERLSTTVRLIKYIFSKNEKEKRKIILGTLKNLDYKNIFILHSPKEEEKFLESEFFHEHHGF